MTVDERTARALHDDAFVFDLHTHAPGFQARAVAALYRFAVRSTMPPDAGFDALAPAGVNAVVGKAVGDPIVTRWHRGSAAHAVDVQLAGVEHEAARAGRLARTVAEIDAAYDAGTTAIVLGVEGADFLDGGDAARIEAQVGALARRGLRVVVPIHLVDNRFGTTCLPWYGFVTSRVPKLRRRPAGLTAIGAALVTALQRHGIVVDISHADEQTARDIVDCGTRAPIVATHTGLHSVGGDFARFLGDDQVKAIAATGGVIGLWPYRHGRNGIPDLTALAAHARAVADMAGVEHLALGTDLNGVPGTSAGYGGIHDLWRVAAALLDAGFGPDDVRAILGANARRVLAACEAAAEH